MKDDRKQALKAVIAKAVNGYVEDHNHCDSIDMKLQLYKEAADVLFLVQGYCDDIRYEICEAAGM